MLDATGQKLCNIYNAAICMSLRSSILNSQAFFGQNFDYWRALIHAKHYTLIMGAPGG
jgi:hypothetical protein